MNCHYETGVKFNVYILKNHDVIVQPMFQGKIAVAKSYIFIRSIVGVSAWIMIQFYGFLMSYF